MTKECRGPGPEGLGRGISSLRGLKPPAPSAVQTALGTALFDV